MWLAKSETPRLRRAKRIGVSEGRVEFESWISHEPGFCVVGASVEEVCSSDVDRENLVKG